MKLTKGLALCLATIFAREAVCAPAIEERTLSRPEGQRQYFVVQANGSSQQMRPAVILLHGYGASAAWVVGRDSFAGFKTQSWTRLAERENILLFAPDGTKGSDGKRAWNDCRGDASTNASADDVGYISALIDTAVTEYHADPQRIYVFGASNGGGMAYRLAIEIGPRLAAIGVQSALMPAQSACKEPSHPLSVFAVHGSQDKIAPYNGGKVSHWAVQGRGSGISAEESVAVWRKLAGLPDTPATYRFPHLMASDSTSATRFVWGNDPAAVQVEFLKIEGGGHVAPSKTESLPWLLRMLLGESNHDIDLDEEAWSFFKDKRAAARHF